MIGRPIMSEDPFDLDFAKLMKAIEDDSKMPNLCFQNRHCTLGFVKYSCL
jgi:hypothetical protein